MHRCCGCALAQTVLGCVDVILLLFAPAPCILFSHLLVLTRGLALTTSLNKPYHVLLQWCAQTVPACGSYQENLVGLLLPAVAQAVSAQENGQTQNEALSGVMPQLLQVIQPMRHSSVGYTCLLAYCFRLQGCHAAGSAFMFAMVFSKSMSACCIWLTCQATCLHSRLFRTQKPLVPGISSLLLYSARAMRSHAAH